MQVIGLLSTEEEAKELQFIAKIYSLEFQIHRIVRCDKIKRLIKEQR